MFYFIAKNHFIIYPIKDIKSTGVFPTISECGVHLHIKLIEKFLILKSVLTSNLKLDFFGELHEYSEAIVSLGPVFGNLWSRQ